MISRVGPPVGGSFGTDGSPAGVSAKLNSSAAESSATSDFQGSNDGWRDRFGLAPDKVRAEGSGRKEGEEEAVLDCRAARESLLGDSRRALGGWVPSPYEAQGFRPAVLGPASPLLQSPSTSKPLSNGNGGALLLLEVE